LIIFLNILIKGTFRDFLSKAILPARVPKYDDFIIRNQFFARTYVEQINRKL
jgi:hypothetical protein